MVPLTGYEDYADILLSKQPDMASGKSGDLDTDDLGGRKAPNQGSTVYQKYAGYISK